MLWRTLWKYFILNIPGPIDLTYTWPSLAESWKTKDFAATFSRKLQRIPKILAEIVVWHFPRVGAHWGDCALIGVCVVRSDMSQLCSCIPLAQAFNCPIRRYFSCNEKRKNLYSFCDSFEITSSCIFEAETGQMRLMVSWWQRTPGRVYDFQAVSNLLLCCHIPCKWPQWHIHEILALWHSCNPIWSAGDASHAGMTWQEKSLSWTDSFDYTEISIFKQNFNHIYLKSSYDFIVQPPREHNESWEPHSAAEYQEWCQLCWLRFRRNWDPEIYLSRSPIFIYVACNQQSSLCNIDIMEIMRLLWGFISWWLLESLFASAETEKSQFGKLRRFLWQVGLCR